jgi:2-polyprenyl-6-hydroxyphenyl methylase/3-demethylubiquinone-9 3-methyltransferase
MGPNMAETTIVPEEVKQFASHAGDWWDPAGSEAMLHKLNPERLC